MDGKMLVFALVLGLVLADDHKSGMLRDQKPLECYSCSGLKMFDADAGDYVYHHDVPGFGLEACTETSDIDYSAADSDRVQTETCAQMEGMISVCNVTRVEFSSEDGSFRHTSRGCSYIPKDDTHREYLEFCMDPDEFTPYLDATAKMSGWHEGYMGWTCYCQKGNMCNRGDPHSKAAGSSQITATIVLLLAAVAAAVFKF